MSIELITIGNEVLSGYTVNTNAAFLGKTLSDLGYQISLETVIPDLPKVIEDTLKKGIERSKLIIVTGGLGITTDDCTKDVASALFKEATFLPNPLGTAPGRLFQTEKSTIIFLPGVPYEMKEIFLTSVVPKLKEWLKEEPLLNKHTLFLLSLKESDINQEFTKLQKAYKDVEIGIYPSLGFLQIRLKSTHDLKEVICKIETQYKDSILTGLSIESALHELFIQKKLSLSVAESCTGGSLAQRFTAQPGASNYFLGGIVSYANEVKENILHVSHNTLTTFGAVSEETVLEMCTNVQKLMKSDIALAVSGIAGPSGGTKEKPVGTVWIALKVKESSAESWCLNLKGNREMVIKESINTILCKLFLTLKNI